MSHHDSKAAGSHAAVTKHADTGAHQTQKSFKTDRRDKPKHSGKVGATTGPKKGGGGGRGTWGRPGDEGAEDAGQLDPNDPNYDPDEAARAGPPRSGRWDFNPASSTQVKFASSLSDLARFKSTVKAACKEYVQSGDASEFCRIVNSLGMSVYHQDLPHILIKYSFDLSDEQRARVSNLLAALHRDGLITQLQTGAGFRKIFNSLSDLLVDAPKARLHLREHVQFAVAGGLLDPQLAKQLEDEQAAISDEKKMAEMKQKIDSISEDYLREEDLSDAQQCIEEEIPAPFRFEVVKRMVSRSLDKGNRQREGASIFLAECTGNLLSQSDVEKGFTILLERVDDLQLDVPNALTYLSIFIARAVVDEVLPPAFLLRVDLGEHDAGTQVLRQAQALLKQENASDGLLYAWETLDAEKNKSEKKSNAEEKSKDE